MNHAPDPIRIYAGSSERQLVPMRVLESSIRHTCSRPVTVTPIYQVQPSISLPKHPDNRPRTDFSFQRFVIPELAGYTGRAIYLDSDMIVFHDITTVWESVFDGAEVLACPRPDATPQFSVLLLDCDRLRWDLRELVTRLDQGILNYRDLMDFRFGPKVSAALPASWNSIEHYEIGVTALLHYSRLPAQPWLHEGHPLEHLWLTEFRRAIDSRLLTSDLVREHIRRGWLRASLAHEIRG